MISFLGRTDRQTDRQTNPTTVTLAAHARRGLIIERFHRQLKSSLKAHGASTHWVEALPLVLLSIRTAVKSDLQCSVAKLVYGTTLRLPGEFFEDALHTVTDPGSMCARLCPPRWNPQTSVVHIRRPVPCHRKGRKFFTIDHNGRNDTVLLDRLKPAYLDSEPQQVPPPPLSAGTTPELPTRVTRSGRRVHFPVRLAYAIP